MDFCYALNALREGKRVERSGWNGKGMWIAICSPTSPTPADIEQKMTVPFIYMNTVHRDFVPWLASQTDILAEDWIICDQVLPGGLNG